MCGEGPLPGASGKRQQARLPLPQGHRDRAEKLEVGCRLPIAILSSELTYSFLGTLVDKYLAELVLC